MLRQSKTVGATTTPFSWDVGAGLPLLLGDGTAQYVYGPGGLLLEQVQGTTPYYYHLDRLGSVRALSDGSGTVQDSYTYDAYGNTTGTGTVANPFGYTGQYLDSESGLYYLRARYYDPATQQFLTLDPLAALTGTPYAYAGGSPVNGIDPSGLDAGGPDYPDDPPYPTGFWCFVWGFCSDAEQWAMRLWEYRTHAAEEIAHAQERAKGWNLPGPYLGGIDDPMGAAAAAKAAVSCSLVGSTGGSGSASGSGWGESAPTGGAPFIKPTWGVNRITKELHDRGFVYIGPTNTSGGRIYEDAAGNQIRIMPRPAYQWRSDPPEKFANAYYYRYKPVGGAWGPHITIPDK